MEHGGLCAGTLLIKLMLMWRVDSWAILQLLAMEMLFPWGKQKKTHKILIDCGDELTVPQLQSHYHGVSTCGT